MFASLAKFGISVPSETHYLKHIHTSIVVMESVLAREADSGRSLPEPGRGLEADSGRVSFMLSIVTSS